MEIVYKNISELQPYKNNPRNNNEAVEYVANSIKEFGFKVPIIIDKNNEIIAGHTRLEASKKLGLKEVPCIIADDLTEEQVKAFRLADNKVSEIAEWDFDLLEKELKDIADLDMLDFGFEINNNNLESDITIPKKGSLQKEFIAPPFTILNANKGYWKERKKEWINLGITDNIGRKTDIHTDNFTKNYKGFENTNETTSLFDPVICEIIYKWFNVNNGKIIDPFAGGSVRGIVAEKLGYKYTGIDLRKEQIEANYKTANKLKIFPNWICGDSINIDKYINPESQDLFFTCPPYADLEKYSNLKNDLSNMEYGEFIKTYKLILQKAIKTVKQNRFLAIVVGDIRNKRGFYKDFISDTKKIFIEEGAKLYNEIIYIQPIGSAVLRANKQFLSYRKNVKIHENILIFYKGDIKEIKNNYKKINIMELEESDKLDELGENYE